MSGASTWRLILSPPAGGRWNMAVDEALMVSAGRGDSPPVLRLYRWQPPCLSLGMAQPAADIDFTRLAQSGWDWVRRPTGGRAILHTDELTYSICAPYTEERIAGSVLESYLRLSKALLAALSILGVDASAREASPAQTRLPGPVCFEVPSAYEITFGGKKLIGSAQARRKEGFLQHGSLPITGDLARITQALVYPSESERAAVARSLLDRAVTLEDAARRSIPWEDCAAAFRQAFAACLQIQWIESGLTPAEESRAATLLTEKFDSPSWNARH